MKKVLNCKIAYEFKTKGVSMRFTESELRTIDKYSKMLGLNRSDFIVNCITYYLLDDIKANKICGSSHYNRFIQGAKEV